MLFLHFLISPPLLILNLITLLFTCSPYCLCFLSHNINHFTVVFNFLSSHFFSKVGAMFIMLVLATLISDRELDEFITWMQSRHAFQILYHLGHLSLYFLVLSLFNFKIAELTFDLYLWSNFTLCWPIQKAVRQCSYIIIYIYIIYIYTLLV